MGVMLRIAKKKKKNNDKEKQVGPGMERNNRTKGGIVPLQCCDTVLTIAVAEMKQRSERWESLEMGYDN